MLCLLLALFSLTAGSWTYGETRWSGTIKAGTIMMRAGTIIPQSLRVETEPYSQGWEIIKNSDGNSVDRDVRRADWNFFFLAAILGDRHGLLGRENRTEGNWRECWRTVSLGGPVPPHGEEEMESSPGFLGNPFGSMPRARDSGDPGATSHYRRPDTAFHLVNSVGIATSRVFGAEPLRPASLLCTLRTHQSPGEWQHSLPVCLLDCDRAGLTPAGFRQEVSPFHLGSSSSKLFPAR